MALICDNRCECFCDRCLAITSYEKPPCPDGHDDDCAEWVCTRCGDAIEVAD
jgi:hypothetical protein